jgi:hypothetical protein
MRLWYDRWHDAGAGANSVLLRRRRAPAAISTCQSDCSLHRWIATRRSDYCLDSHDGPSVCRSLRFLDARSAVLSCPDRDLHVDHAAAHRLLFFPHAGAGTLAISAIVGMAIHVIGGALSSIGTMIDVTVPLPRWLEATGGCVLVVCLFAAALIAPFLLMQWREIPPAEEVLRSRVRWLAKKTGIGLILLFAMVGISNWASLKMYDHDCAQIVTSVKINHPAAGFYPNLVLPTSQRPFAEEVDALVLPDGRIILVVKTLIVWHGNWRGTIYASGPITAGEIGTDAYGRPIIKIDGLPVHYIMKQVSPQHFDAAADLR